MDVPSVINNAIIISLDSPVEVEVEVEVDVEVEISVIGCDVDVVVEVVEVVPLSLKKSRHST